MENKSTGGRLEENVIAGQHSNKTESVKDSGTGAIDADKVVKFVQEAKDKKMTKEDFLTSFNGDVGFIDDMANAVGGGARLFTLTRKNMEANKAYAWLRGKQRELKKMEKGKKNQQGNDDRQEKTQNTATIDIEKKSKKYIDIVDKFVQDFSNGEISGEAIYKKAGLFYDITEVDLKNNNEMQIKVAVRIRKIDPEIQEKMIKSMIDYAVANNKDPKEILKRVKYLTMHGEINEIPGLDENMKKWLNSENTGFNRDTVSQVDIENAGLSGTNANEQKESSGDYREQLTKILNNIKNDLEENDTVNGETIFDIAKLLKESNDLGGEGKEITNSVFDDIFPKNSSLRGDMVDAMAVYADSIGISGQDVAEKYLPFFESIQHIGRADVYKWLMGYIDRLPENSPKTEVKEKTDDAGEQKKKLDAQSAVDEMATLINSNDFAIDTNFLLKLREEVVSEMDNEHNYDLAVPMGEFIKSLMDKKEKFNILKKGGNAGNRDSDQKEKLINEVKEELNIIEKIGKLGSTDEEVHKNKKAILDILNDKHFRGKI